jgi:hypothetical protein
VYSLGSNDVVRAVDIVRDEPRYAALLKRFGLPDTRSPN